MATMYVRTYSLIIIDMQNDYLDRIAPEKRNNIIHNTNELSTFFSNRKLPVYVIHAEQGMNEEDAMPKAIEEGFIPAVSVAGTPGAAFPAALKIPSSSKNIKKPKYSAFYGTRLTEMLDKSGKGNTLVLCGINAHACVLSTAVDAVQRGFHVIVARDCVASYDEEYERVALRYLGTSIGKLLSNREIMTRVATTPAM